MARRAAGTLTAHAHAGTGTPSRAGQVGAGQRAAVLQYCHHSVGLGHLVRSLAVAGALAQRFRVVVCSGGPIPEGVALPGGVEIVPLPPIGATPTGELASLDPSLTLGEAWARRAELLLSCYHDLQPAALMVELFPLGRRKFARELLPVLEAVRAGGTKVPVICSVRDLLVNDHPDQQRHDDEAAERLNRLFDAVIVHGDPQFARLEETFRPTVPVSVPVHYSGLVTARTDRPAGIRRWPPQVLVSAGGGMVGRPLFEAAVHAHRVVLQPWGVTTRIVTGPFLPAEDFAALAMLAGGCDGLTVERFVPDLCAAMVEASASVSQCGYNTALDVLRSGVPAVVVPYDAGHETEQTERVRRLAALGVVTMLRSHELSPRRLGEEILGVLGVEPRPPAVGLDGAHQTAALVGELIGKAARWRS